MGSNPCLSDPVILDFTLLSTEVLTLSLVLFGVSNSLLPGNVGMGVGEGYLYIEGYLITPLASTHEVLLAPSHKIMMITTTTTRKNDSRPWQMSFFFLEGGGGGGKIHP